MKQSHRAGSWITAASVIAVMVGLVTTGCSTMESSEQSEQSEDDQRPLKDPIYSVGCSTTLQPEHRVELDLIDSLMEGGEYYAALAQLESLSFETQHHWLRWAQLLAQVDQVKDSEEAFETIADKCESHEAYHGLGVVYVKQDKIQDALDALKTAKDMSPAVPDIRNDYGYALMIAGEYGRAAFELRTAYELAEGKGAVKQNMVAAYYLNGGDAALNKLKGTLGLSERDLKTGKQVAENMRKEHP
ncbi:tetratricopeptide repeat protein [Marinobacter sp. HL-58]|uniref:tetratricopeptide repeat protein n=1 Tax=Marinobacter sp. HL-58 TaxID=1479237 RepID=UPI0006D9C5F7|nr:hypothetical protein [Marinobacter sp. HL-58]KPP97805.1 MAG: Tad secretion system assembly platform TadD [Marinobacter sp. HL-58]